MRSSSLRNHILAILKDQRDSNSKLYSDFVRELKQLLSLSKHGQSQTDCKKLRVLLVNLASCTSEVDSERHSSMLVELVDVQYIDYPIEIQDAMNEFFVNLMLMDCAMIPACLSSLAISLVPFLATVQDHDPSVRWQAPIELLSMQNKILDTVGKVYKLIPNVGGQFLLRLQAKQPFYMRPLESHCLYLTAIFEMMRRPMGQDLHHSLWSSVVDHLLDIDKYIPVNIDCTSEKAADSVFDLEIDGAMQLDNRQSSELQRLTDTMDSMMEIVFSQIERFESEGRLGQIWKTLLVALDHQLIDSYQIQFTHYLIFFVASNHPEKYLTDLTKICIAKIEDASISPSTRSSYILYISSLLSRMRAAPQALRIYCLESILSVCEEYARRYSAKPDNYPCYNLLQAHQLYFSCVQGILNMLCFMVSNLNRNGLEEKLRGLVQRRVSSLLYHWLDPFNRIAERIAAEFCDIAESYGIIHCRHLADPSRDLERLDSHLPFDPYLLERSKGYLRLNDTYVYSTRTLTTNELISEMEEEMVLEGLSLDENKSQGSSLPYYNSYGSSLLSDGI